MSRNLFTAEVSLMYYSLVPRYSIYLLNKLSNTTVENFIDDYPLILLNISGIIVYMERKSKKEHILAGRIENKLYTKFLNYIYKKRWTITEGLEEAIYLLVETKKK